MSTKWTTLAMKLPRTVPILGAMPPVVYPNEVIRLILLKMPFVLGFVFFFFFFKYNCLVQVYGRALYTISSIIFHITSRVFGRWLSTLL